MDKLKASFEDVANWCEKHLEVERGREIGMTFGAMLKAYGRLAALSSRLSGDNCDAKERELNAKAEKLLYDFTTRFLVDYESSKSKIVEPVSMRTNMTYDPGPRPPE